MRGSGRVLDKIENPCIAAFRLSRDAFLIFMIIYAYNADKPACLMSSQGAD